MFFGKLRISLSALAFGAAISLTQAGTAAAQDGPFNNASLQGTYTYATIFSNPGEPSPSSAIIGMFYFDGDGNWIFANLITNLPGEPDEEGNPTRFLMNSLADTELPWPHVTGTYTVNPDGSFLYYIQNGWGLFEGVVTGAEMIDGVLTLTEFLLVDTVPSRFGGGLVVFEGWRIVSENILPPGE
jgi:hypothetical protein